MHPGIDKSLRPRRYVHEVDGPTEVAQGVIMALRDSFREIGKTSGRTEILHAMDAASDACEMALRHF